MAAPQPAYTADDVVVHPAVGRFDAFAELVGPRDGSGRGCWCLAYRVSSGEVPMDERPASMAGLCSHEPGPGVLAFLVPDAAGAVQRPSSRPDAAGVAAGELAVGWCSVAPRSTYRRLTHSRTIPALAADEGLDPYSIVCFVVRTGHRRRGLMHLLLDGAVEHARGAGATVVEGYPVAAGGRVDTTSGYVGSQELFEQHGFTKASDTTSHHAGRGRVIMRREL